MSNYAKNLHLEWVIQKCFTRVGFRDTHKFWTRRKWLQGKNGLAFTDFCEKSFIILAHGRKVPLIWCCNICSFDFGSNNIYSEAILDNCHTFSLLSAVLTFN
jgi:hypothetical protein